MTASRTQGVQLFVDRSSQQWIVKDREGRFWVVALRENSWEHRQPFAPTNETDLEPIPAHYKYMFDLPP
jgi:hypothetical protein